MFIEFVDASNNRKAINVANIDYFEIRQYTTSDSFPFVLVGTKVFDGANTEDSYAEQEIYATHDLHKMETVWDCLIDGFNTNAPFVQIPLPE